MKRNEHIIKTVLVTGASGFIGKALCAKLLAEGHKVKAGLRSEKRKDSLPVGSESVVIGEIGSETNWGSVLDGVDTVIHLAARVHVMKETAEDPRGAFRAVNVAGTERLSRAAIQSGVKRFVFLSSIGVNGESTKEKPFSEKDEPHPATPYALSKLEAENVLCRVASDSEMEVVIIRPPLVYGPENPGNFLRMLSLVNKNWPSPLRSVSNRRSFIYIGNLVDAIFTCIENEKAAGQVYLVSDGEDISTPELFRVLSDALGYRPHLFCFPPSVMYMVGKVLGKSTEVDKLIGSLTVDISKIRSELSWEPPFSGEEGLRETATWYRGKESSN